jgi:hypothetical protein
MRRTLPIAALLCTLLTACAPSAPPPAAQSPATPDPRDPQVRAQAVEQATLEAKQRQDEALEKQGG